MSWSVHRRTSRLWLGPILALVLCAAGGSAEAAVGIGATGTTTSNSVSGFVTTATATWSTATGANNLLVAILTYNGGATPGAATGWVQATSVANGTNVSTAIYYFENAASQTSASFTATGTSSAPALSVQLLELQGMVTSNSLDVTATNTASAASSLTVTPGSNTVNPQDVAIISFAHDNPAKSYQWGNVPAGFTALSQLANTTRSISGYRTVAAAGTNLTEKMSLHTANKTANMVGAVVSFKANVAAYYWRGGASDCVTAGGLWTNAACWAATSGGAANTGNTIPAAGDMAVFDGGWTGNCTISSTISVGTIDVKSGYTGTITHSGSSNNINLAGSWLFETGATGTFNSTATGGTIATLSGGAYIGDLVMAGGTFSLNGAALNLRSLTVSTGTFTSGSTAVTINSGGTVSLTGTSPPTTTTVTFGTGGLTPNSGTVTVDGAVVSMGTANFTATGAVSVLSGSMTFGTGTVTFNGGVTVSGGTLSMPTMGSHTATTVDVSGGTMAFAAGTTFGVSGNFLLEGGSVTQSSATLNLGTNVQNQADGLTITDGTFDAGTGTLNVTGPAGGNDNGSGAATTINGSTASFTSQLGGHQNFYGILNVTAGTMTLGVAAMTSGRKSGGDNVDKQVLIRSGGTLSLTSNFTFPSTLAMTINGTLNGVSGNVTFTPAVTIGSTGTYAGTAAAATFSSTLTVNGTCGAGAGSLTSTGAATIGSTGTYSGNTGTSNFNGGLTVNGACGAGTNTFNAAATTIASTGTYNGNTGNSNFSSTLAVTGACSAGTGALAVTGAVTIAGTYNANSGTTTFNSTTALSGTFNANSTSNATLKGVVTMTGTSVFNGNTGKTTFTAAPTLTAGTFNVGDVGSTGSVLLSASTTFTSGMTLAFPTSGGDLKIGQGFNLSVAGTVTSSAGTTASKPKIECSGCSATQGVGITFSGVLNVDGLEFDNATTAGVTIASGATFTKFQDLTFKNNAGNSAGGTHLAITLGTKVLDVPGCYFDTTATKNVALSGTSGQNNGARAIFEYRGASSTVTGPGAGNSMDDDGDKGVNGDTTANDNVGGNVNSPYFGSVVEWVYAAPTDTAGTAVGFPTAAFDWNTFSYYGVYVAYKDVTGAGTADTLWMRNSDGSPAYSFSVPQTSGDLVWTPFWDTVNETTAGIDANGDGDQADTDVRVVYLATTGGHIIKLVDNGSGLARPGSGSPWSADFTDSNVSTITSPLANDGTNLYFGGTKSGSAEVFGVQVAKGANEAKLVKTVGAATTVTTTPSWATSSGSTYVFLGSNVISGASHIYRINMTSGTVDADYSGATTNINGAIVIVSNHAYASSDAGKMYALDALNFASGGFTTITGFPYQTAAAAAIKFAPWVDSTSTAYFGDDSGKLYDLSSAGSLATGYPVSISSSKITSTPIYRSGGGVIGVGANDGYAYFVDRSAASIFKRFFVTSTSNAVSSVSYDSNIAAYMVSSSDGKLVFINGADVTDPTSGTP
jgi:hypothetical protein